MASRKLLLAVLAAGTGLLSAPKAHSEESIWTGLVLASNEEHPKAAAPELEKYWNKLRNIFGYNEYELLGQRSETLTGPGEHWIIPRKDFFLCVTSRLSEKPGSYRMKMDLYQEKNLLAQMEARVSGQNLLFIRGPAYDKGRIIIILMVK